MTEMGGMRNSKNKIKRDQNVNSEIKRSRDHSLLSPIHNDFLPSTITNNKYILINEFIRKN